MKIKLKGNEYGLHWGLGALRIFCETTGLDIDKGIEIVAGLGEHNYLERTAATNNLIWAAVKNYGNIHEIDVSEVRYIDVELYSDETSVEVFQLVKDDFMHSMFNGKSMAEILGVNLPQKADVKQKKSARQSIKQSLSSTK